MSLGEGGVGAPSRWDMEVGGEGRACHTSAATNGFVWGACFRPLSVSSPPLAACPPPYLCTLYRCPLLSSGSGLSLPPSPPVLADRTASNCSPPTVTPSPSCACLKSGSRSRPPGRPLPCPTRTGSKTHNSISISSGRAGAGMSGGGSRGSRAAAAAGGAPSSTAPSGAGEGVQLPPTVKGTFRQLSPETPSFPYSCDCDQACRQRRTAAAVRDGQAAPPSPPH